jgi:CrcB protein
MTLLYLVVGGALGTIARHYLADRVAEGAGSPAVGIFAVNIAGSFLIGLFFALGEGRFEWSYHTRVLVATGFLGGFTTFSTLVSQTRDLASMGDFAAAALNIGASMVAGLAAVYAGTALGRTG